MGNEIAGDVHVVVDVQEGCVDIDTARGVNGGDGCLDADGGCAGNAHCAGAESEGAGRIGIGAVNRFNLEDAVLDIDDGLDVADEGGDNGGDVVYGVVGRKGAEVDGGVGGDEEGVIVIGGEVAAVAAFEIAALPEAGGVAVLLYKDSVHCLSSTYFLK